MTGPRGLRRVCLPVGDDRRRTNVSLPSEIDEQARWPHHAHAYEVLAFMMREYNVSDHWPSDEPVWVKSLVSSLYRRHSRSTILPLTLVVEEIAHWVELASGSDAWRKPGNRASLRFDLDDSARALGGSLRAHVDVPLRRLTAAFDRLSSSPRAVLAQPPGMRTDDVWIDISRAAEQLLAHLDSNAAVGACWDNLVATAQNRTLACKEYRPIADLLFDQLRRRGLDSPSTFRHLVWMVAFGLSPEDLPIGTKDVELEERIAHARTIACTPAKVEPIVVWLGYQGRTSWRLSAGHVKFLDAHWAVPNAAPEGQFFEHKEELWELVQHGHLFKVAERVDEESDVDGLVRVDLGDTTAAGALTRAVDIVNVVLDVSIHNSGGSRPHLAQYGVLQSGRAGNSSFMHSHRETSFPDDHYGAGITADAIDEYGPRILEALARQQLPRFLAAALDVQMTAHHPFSREMVFREPSEADISSVIPLADRVVQHVAAHVAITPDTAFEVLGERWPHARWLTDIRRAVHMCLLGGGSHDVLRDALLDELTREWYASNPNRPWILFVADRAADLLSMCRIESERAWIERMFRSVSDHAEYAALRDVYRNEQQVLEARRRRVRNALVHGNPASFPVVKSVREVPSTPL